MIIDTKNIKQLRSFKCQLCGKQAKTIVPKASPTLDHYQRLKIQQDGCFTKMAAQVLTILNNAETIEKSGRKSLISTLKEARTAWKQLLAELKTLGITEKQLLAEVYNQS